LAPPDAVHERLLEVLAKAVDVLPPSGILNGELPDPLDEQRQGLCRVQPGRSKSM